jgi:NADH:ubiquinone oxidoreductase subunit K
MTPTLWGVLIAIVLAIIFLLGMLFERNRFTMTTEMALRREIQKLIDQNKRHETKIEQQVNHIATLNIAVRGEQARQILQSHGWRPLGGESLPGDGEQILVAGKILTPESLAPNGYYYARFRKRDANHGTLTYAGSAGKPVPLDGSVLWMPQRSLVS